uniref:Torsin n=1 Tax=Hemiscolopendra marginata TaxID=943146 RepID=A0A646QHR3_9MYRI
MLASKFLLTTFLCGYLCLLQCQNSTCFEPVTMGLVVGGLGLAGIYAGVEYIRCIRYECCHPQWIQANFSGLETALHTKLHGQHLVHEIVLRSVRNHVKKVSPKKALVLSFHGWTGSGKNFVSKIIAEHLYVNGLKSRYVHQFIATLHFPHEDLSKIYQDDLRTWIRGNISKCEQSLFIFDEMDKMPPGVVDALKPFIDYHDHVDGKNFRRSIFIFLSNTGGQEITSKAFEFWKNGLERERITMKDMEKLIRLGAFNEKGGLKHSYIIERHLIDFHVPFLPLERRHVKECIKDEMRDQNAILDNDIIERVADELIYYPRSSNTYSTSGCKRISQLLATELEKNL